MHKGRVIYLTDYEESFPIAGGTTTLETDKFRRSRDVQEAETLEDPGQSAICSPAILSRAVNR